MLDNTLLPCETGTLPPGVFTGRKSTRDSLISTWRTRAASRQAYEARAAHHIDLKVRFSDIAPELQEALRAADTDGKGYILQHELQHLLLIRFGILLGAVELECLKAEWQVLDPVTQHVDYQALLDYCRPGTLHEYVTTLRTQHLEAKTRPAKETPYYPHLTGPLAEVQPLRTVHL